MVIRNCFGHSSDYISLQYRTIRTLRAQLKQTKSSLDQLRSESGVTKANWIAHIDDLKDKLKSMREARLKWEQEGRGLKAELDESREKEEKAKKELETQGAASVTFVLFETQVLISSAWTDSSTCRIKSLWTRPSSRRSPSTRLGALLSLYRRHSHRH